MKSLLFISFTFLFAACSGSKSTTESMDAGIELADAVEFSEESEDVVGESMEDPFMDSMAEPVGEEAMANAPESSPVEVDPLVESPVSVTAEIGTYTVRENETLMMMAFNLYGDYAKWREIARLNEDKLGASTVVQPGMELKYNVPAEPFMFNPSGNPYLVTKGDHLGGISDKTYGTSKLWKEIWENNKPLIKDPNVIFAGFTIYTPLIEGRDVAFDGQ